jgi:hypothetical protein
MASGVAFFKDGLRGTRLFATRVTAALTLSALLAAFAIGLEPGRVALAEETPARQEPGPGAPIPDAPSSDAPSAATFPGAGSSPARAAPTTSRPASSAGSSPGDRSWFQTGGLGALEVGLRYSYLDLNDGPVRAGRTNIVMTGLNWYWNAYLKLRLDYGYAAIESPLAHGGLHIVQSRLELDF